MIKTSLQVALCILLAISVASCWQKEEDEQVIPDVPTGPQYDDGTIFIYEPLTGTLTEAHGAVIVLPAVAGVTEVSFVPFGLGNIYKMSGPDDIVVEALYENPPYGDDVYGEQDGMVQYVQKMKISYGDKPDGVDKVAVYKVLGYDGISPCVAIFTLKQ